MADTGLGWLGVGVGALQTGIGLFQKSKLKEPKSPIKTVSPKIGQMIDIYRQQASQSEMPGQNVLEQKLKGTTSAGIRSIENVSGGGGTSAQAIANLYAGQASMLNDLTASAAKWRASNKAAYAGALEKGAAEEDVAWKYNKWAPYQRSIEKYDAAMATANKNISAGIGNIVGSANMMGTSQPTYGQTYGSPAAGMANVNPIQSPLLQKPELSAALMAM